MPGKSSSYSVDELPNKKPAFLGVDLPVVFDHPKVVPIYPG